MKKVIADVEKICGNEPCDADTGRINAYVVWGKQIDMQNPDSAIVLWKESEKIASAFIKTQTNSALAETANKGLAEALNNIGIIYKKQADYPNALEYFNKCLNVKEVIGDKMGMASSYNSIGIIYKNLGDIPRALENYNKCLKIREDVGDKMGIATSFSNIGIIYYMQGDIVNALEYFNKGLSIQEAIEDKNGMAVSYNNIGFIYKNQGDNPKALEYYNKSLIIREAIDDKRGIAESFNNIGTIYNYQKDISKALEYFNKSSKILELISDKQGMASSYNNIGIIYDNQGDIPKALEYYNKSLNIYEEIGFKQGMAYSFNNIGSLYFENNALVKAEIYVKKGHELSKELGYPENIKNSALFLKNIYIAENLLKEADTIALEIIDISNKSIISNFSTLPELGQEKYLTTVSENYMDFNSYSLYRKSGNPSIVDIVYNNTIKNKGLLLKSSTAMRNAVLNSNDTLLIDNYNKWIHLKKQIADLYSKGKDTKELDEQANEYEKELVKSSQLFSDFNKLQNISWLDVQKGLKTSEVAIEFIQFNYMNFKSDSIRDFLKFTDTVLYCALIVKPESQHPEMIRLFNEKDLIAILDKVGGNNLNYINNIYGKNKEAKTELYNLIWKPMEEQLKGVKKVYLSPTGLLHKISFAALCKEQNIYLCDNIDIKVQSSTGKLAMPENFAFKDNMSATLFGGINYNSDSTKTEIWKYLAGTKLETEKIESILKKGNVTVNYFSFDAASEEKFKEIASTSNIMHLSTHGYFYPDPKDVKKEVVKTSETGKVTFRGGSNGFGIWSFVKNPNPLMRSGLVLAGANDVWSRQNSIEGDDGVLTAQEVAHIDMRKTDLVVLSACETGLGDIKGSEGVYGLQRAFKMAGVKFIIMSLWQVPDKETVEFMETFYTKLLKQKDIRLAFADTQKEMRQKYDPYYWAAFVLVE